MRNFVEFLHKKGHAEGVRISVQYTNSKKIHKNEINHTWARAHTKERKLGYMELIARERGTNRVIQAWQ
jgi:fructosamine-3-kinase